MFQLSPAPTFSCQVPLSVAGIPEPMALQVTFRHKNKTQLQAWVESALAKPDVAVLHEVIKDWSGMQGADGQEVPYSQGALSDLLNNYPISHAELYQAYVRELGESKRKNS